jgi:hypothetical protein
MRVPTGLLSAVCTLAAAFFVLWPASALATSSPTEIDAAIEKAIAFSAAQQDPATGEPPGYDRGEILYTGEWLASGYAAVGLSPADVAAAGGPSLQDFLYSEAAGVWSDPTALIAPENAARLNLIARAAGIDPARVSADQNLNAELIGEWQPTSGGFGGMATYDTAWGALALAGSPLPQWGLAPFVAYLRGDQHFDGGWSANRRAEGEASNPDTTAVAVGALCTAGVPAYDPAVIAGLAFLHGLLVDTSGAIEHPENGLDLDTTAWTVNALNACGIDPQSSDWTAADGKTPIDFLLSLQLESGGFPWLEGESWFPPSTAHALRALAGKGFAVAPAPRQDASSPLVRPVPAVPSGTPTPHVLAIELAPGAVRLCTVTVPVGATLLELLAAAKAGGQPAGCVSSFSASEGVVAEIDGISPPGTGETWLARLDRGATSPAAAQTIGFGDLVSLRVGPTPATPAPPTTPGTPPTASGPTGPAGPEGKPGRVGRGAAIVCKVKKRHRKRHLRCYVKRLPAASSRPLRASS